MNYGTLPSRFLNAVDTHPNPRAQMVRRDGRWEAIASQEFLRRVAGLSTAFVELGVKPGDRVGLFSANRPEWHTADFAVTGAGAVTVPVYFNESPDRMTCILKHCGAKVVFVVGVPQLRKLLAVRSNLPELEQIVAADGSAEVPSECLRYETLIAGASAADVASYRMRASQVLPGQLASLIYTSGTTGEPKGVMLTHTNFCSNVTDVGHDFQLNPSEDVALSFLPLAHVYGRTMDYIYIFHGAALAYVEFIDAVAQALLEVRPTITAAVPRFFEKIYARLVEQGSKNTGVRRMLFDWAMRVAEMSAQWRASQSHANLAVTLQQKLADALVYRKIRIGMGGRLRLISSGGAPLSKELAEFFWAVGIPIYQGYGLTETSPIVSSNYPENRMGSSGKPIPNIQVRGAEDADQGIKFASNTELAAHPWVRALIDSEVKRLTVHLAQYETIKRFALLPEDFTFDNGSLTFTLKLKRRVVEQQYATVIESLYAGVAEPRPILQN